MIENVILADKIIKNALILNLILCSVSILQKLMNFFKSLFSTSLFADPKESVDKYLNQARVFQKGSLNISYQYLLANYIAKVQQPVFFINQLISRLKTTKNVSTTVKLLTVIHFCINERQYDKFEVQCLEQAPIPIIQDAEQKKWFDQFLNCYLNYLRKISSINDIYIKASRVNSGKLNQSVKQTHLTQVFRIVNQMGLLFPGINNLTNVIGRYYMNAYPEFPLFYQTLNKQITMMYNYLKLLVDEILSKYRQCKIIQLQCFINTIPQLELICDKMEDILLNKYFKGKSLNGKIYFKQQKVQQIKYFLEYEVKIKNQDVTQLVQNQC